MTLFWRIVSIPFLLGSLLLAPPAAAGGVSRAIKQLREGQEFGYVEYSRTKSQLQSESSMTTLPTHANQTWRVSGDTVEVVFEPGSDERRELRAERIQVLFSGDTPVAVVVALQMGVTAILQDDWKDLGELEPMRFERWSSAIGCLYQSRIPNLYLNLPGPDAVAAGDDKVKLVRILLPDAWDSGRFGTVESIDPLLPQIREAAKKEDMRALRTIFAGRERPRVGPVGPIYDRIEARDPDGAYLNFQSAAEAAGADWTARIALLRNIQEEYRRLKHIQESEEMVPQALRHPVDLAAARKRLESIARTGVALPEVLRATRLVHEAAIAAAFGDNPPAASVTEWLKSIRPYIDNLEELTASRPGLRDLDLFYGTGPWHMGLRTGDIADEVAGDVTLDIGPLDLSALQVKSGQRLATSGGWVSASRSQLENQALVEQRRKEQEGAGQRLAQIDAELRAIDSTPAGQEVKGAAGEQVVWRYVDQSGHVTDIVGSESPQNVYRVGVSRDIKARAARKRELMEEQARLRSLQNVSLPNAGVVDGKIYDPKGASEWQEGFILGGPARRTLTLRGQDVSVSEVQEMGVYIFAEQRDALDPAQSLATIEGDFDNGGSHTNSGKPLPELLPLLYRKAVGEFIDHEIERQGGVTAPGMAEERAWARAMFGLEQPPNRAIYNWISDGK